MAGALALVQLDQQVPPDNWRLQRQFRLRRQIKLQRQFRPRPRPRKHLAKKRMPWRWHIRETCRRGRKWSECFLEQSEL